MGGVVSPVLANLVLHLAFDAWMQATYPAVPFERYADDIVVHCVSRTQADDLRTAITRRLAQCRLRVHPAKTKIVYCKDSNRPATGALESFDFLGFTFRPRRARNARGVSFVSFLPAISAGAAKAIRQAIRRRWRLACRTDKDLKDLARMLGSHLRGWIGYYGRFYRSAMGAIFRPLEEALVRWATRKYKRFRGHWIRASQWLQAIRRHTPTLFPHWPLLGTPTAG